MRRPKAVRHEEPQTTGCQWWARSQTNGRGDPRSVGRGADADAGSAGRLGVIASLLSTGDASDRRADECLRAAEQGPSLWSAPRSGGAEKRERPPAAGVVAAAEPGALDAADDWLESTGT